MQNYCQTEGQLTRRQEADLMSYENPSNFDCTNRLRNRMSDQKLNSNRALLTSYGSTDQGVNLVKKTITQLPRSNDLEHEERLLQDW